MIKLSKVKSANYIYNWQILKIYTLLFIFVAVLIETMLVFAESKLMGTASCASSNCHGNSSPIKASNVLQNEFVTWYKHDSHAKAYSVLLNEQSKRIAHNLSIPAPEKNALCLSCHSTYEARESLLGEKYRVSDGVSCESCHGAAGNWLKEHASSKTSYANNVNLGMSDLKNIKVKTELCLSCHLGNDAKTVNHSLIGAGHPRLTFEQDTFESVMPRHWKTSQMEEGTSSAKRWLESQAIQAAERTKILYSKNRSHAGLFPEFSNLHCYTCHHNLSQKQYQSREYGGSPGIANLNTSELWVLSRSLIAIDASKAKRLQDKTSQLREMFGKKDISSIAANIVAFLNEEIIPLLASKVIRKEEEKQLFNQLLTISNASLQYETAEQIVMGAAAIAASSDSEQMKKELSTLYRALDNPEKFDPKLFRKAPHRAQ